MATEELDFMRDQVQRLNLVLSEYQNKYPPLGLKQREDDIQPEVPWVSDRTLMSPLIAEYDASLLLMKEQISRYQVEQKDLRSQVDKLVAENNRLTKELKESIGNQLNAEPPHVSTTPTDGSTLVEEQALHNLQHQLQMALQEKDSAMEMWQAAVSEVERLERSVQNQQFNPRLQALEHQANQIKQQYTRTVSELNNEITTLQEELTISKNETKLAQNQSIQLRKTLEDLRKQINLQEHELVELDSGKKYTDAKAGVLHKQTVSFETKLKQAEIELNQLKHDNSSLEERLDAQKKKCADYEQKVYEASIKLRENTQIAECAVLEKDEAILREKKANEEIARLQEAVSTLLNQAGARTREEVDAVRQQCNQNINSLMEEIHNLELDNSEKQAQIDRAMREKRAAESELEKIYQEGMVDCHKEKSAYDELNRRACDAERLRDEAKVKMEAMLNETKRMEMTLRQDKNHLLAEVDQLKDRVSVMNQELELANDDRVKLTGKIDELQRKMAKLQQERDKAQRDYNKETTCRDKDEQLKLKEFEVRLATTEDSHRKAMMELRQMLGSQQRMSAKWKEECQSLTSKFEGKVNDLRDELKREKSRSGEMSKLLKESRDTTLEVENRIAEYTRNIKRLEERVRESETRTANVTMLASRSMRPDKDIVEERKQLQRELERSLRESGLSHSTGPDPIALSDLVGSHTPGAGLINGTMHDTDLLPR